MEIVRKSKQVERKAQNGQIKERLLHFACHHNKWWNWCVLEYDKNKLEPYFDY